MAEADTITAPRVTNSDPLLQRLLARGWEFDFFQAVWLLERYGAINVPVGGRGPVGQERLRFRPDISVGFPPTDLRRVTQYTDSTGDKSHYLFEVTFLGLYGVSTPLPLHYAIDLLRSVYHAGGGPRAEAAASVDAGDLVDPGTRSTPTRDFLDVFHHRVISLFYRSWLKYRYYRSFGLPGRDVITDYLLWLIGYAPDSDKATLGVSPIQLLRYAGSLTQRPRSAIMLQGMLLDYWEDLPVEVEQCVGRWVPVPPADRNCIGLANCRLGSDLTVGEQVYDLSGAFTITLGPMDWTTYLSFLPGGPRYAETCALVQRFCADPLSFTIELELRAGEVPEMMLGSQEEGSRLGFTSWVVTEEMAETSVSFKAKG